VTDEYRAVITISLVDDTLRKAEEVLSLIEANREKEHALSACVAVALASALLQGIQTALKCRSSQYSALYGVPVAETQAYRLLHGPSFRQKMLELPHVLTDGGFRIRRSAPTVSALEELIALRNALAHVRDPHYDLTMPAKDLPDLVQEGETCSAEASQVVAGSGWLQMLVTNAGRRQLKNPWSSVTAEETKKYRAAVREYLDSIAFADDPSLSDLVEPASP
jgi:hypothetical protein